MMIVPIIYVIFDRQLKITFRKSSSPPEKIHSPLFTHSSPKNTKSASPLLFAKIENFSGLSLQKRGWREDTVVILTQEGHSSKILFQFYFILCWQLKNIRIKVYPILFKYANEIQRNLNLILNTNVPTKNLLYFLNLNYSYFIINLDQQKFNFIQNSKFAI